MFTNFLFYFFLFLIFVQIFLAAKLEEDLILSYENKIKYIRFDPSKQEWDDSFGAKSYPFAYGPVHIWMRCYNNTIRGSTLIEPLNDDATFKDDTALVQKLNLNNPDYDFALFINNEKARFTHSTLPWDKNIASSSTFYHTLKHYARPPTLEFRINLWQRTYSISTMSICGDNTPPIEDSNAKELAVLINLADGKSGSTLPDGVEIHYKYHSKSIGFDFYQLLIRPYEVPMLMHSKFIQKLVSIGKIKLFIKPDYLPEMKGKLFIYQNYLFICYLSNQIIYQTRSLLSLAICL